jgi:hypothetical protein
MQSKLGLIAVLRKFDVHLANIIKGQLTWNPLKFFLTPREDIKVNITHA